MNTHFTLRNAVHPHDFRSYDTQRIRQEFLIEKLMEADSVHLVYSQYDRMIAGGACHRQTSIKLISFCTLVSLASN